MNAKRGPIVKVIGVILLVGGMIAINGCTKREKATGIGAVVGGGAGAAVGGVAGGPVGAGIGAGVGAVTGGVVGNIVGIDHKKRRAKEATE